jgi:hypothetical protein
MEMQPTYEADLINNVRVQVLEIIGAGEGSISAGELSDSTAHEMAEAARARLVRVSPEAPSCCIDGRCAECTLEGSDAATEPRPSVAGGADVTAYAAAELSGYFSVQDSRSSSEKLAEIDIKLRKQGLNPGAHCDEAAVANGFTDPADIQRARTGCGAGDKLSNIIKKFYDMPEPIATYTSALLGVSYDANAKLPEQALVQRRTSQWDPRAVIDVTSSASAGRNVEVLQGDHSELLVVFNFVSDSTVDRDALVQETGKQVFVVDMWYIDKLATALAAGRHDAEELEPKLRQYMVGYQIATYLTLCDGTQRPVLFTPAVAA